MYSTHFNSLSLEIEWIFKKPFTFQEEGVLFCAAVC